MRVWGRGKIIAIECQTVHFNLGCIHAFVYHTSRARAGARARARAGARARARAGARARARDLHLRP